MTKKYILIVRYENNRESLLNQALYSSRAEAEKFREWFKIKIKAEREASEKFWKEKPMKIEQNIIIGEVNY